MSFSYARICAEVFDRPLLYEERKAETFLRAFGPRLTGHSVSIVNGVGGVERTAFENGRLQAGLLGDRMGRSFDRAGLMPFDLVENVAIIPVEGTLVQKGAWLGENSGETSYQGLQVQISRAMRGYPDVVKGIVYEVDSFGGLLNGAFETADLMRQSSKLMPTIAILTDFAYSAGYLLASQARQIIVPEFGGAGSIGVVMMHADFSGNLKQEGIKVTFIHAGKRKVDGSPFLPLPDDLKEKWQAEVDAARDRFATVAAKGRGSRLTKSAALKTEAEAFGAAAAVDHGLADAIGDPQAAFAAFIKEVNRR